MSKRMRFALSRENVGPLAKPLPALPPLTLAGTVEPLLPPDSTGTSARSLPVLAPLAFTINEAAARLRISRNLIYELAKTGELRITKVASRSLVLAADLDSFVSGLRQGGGRNHG